ncbi:hypothetical protein DdX_05106 [Ditylenchus destructor]|uniref:Uncharacterized protein n=1 Tax=Ditylenchus destructor TaxID=166010 RepID=A0AAD4N8R2_9BILA|nr:hypothetical protein DdX_05106 [Ditylenchus destructor]
MPSNTLSILLCDLSEPKRDGCGINGGDAVGKVMVRSELMRLNWIFLLFVDGRRQRSSHSSAPPLSCNQFGEVVFRGGWEVIDRPEVAMEWPTH